MADFPYITASGKRLKYFLAKIQEIGVPEIVNSKWLFAIGFKSSNDRRFISVLKFLGFIGQNGRPTKIWMEHRNETRSPKVLASALRKGYTRLFEVYPQPWRLDNNTLKSFFYAYSSSTELVIERIVRTFKTLCEMVDFEVSSKEFPSIPTEITNLQIYKELTSVLKQNLKQLTEISPPQDELFEEAIKCIENEIYRAAHVMAWSAFMGFLEMKLDSDGLKKLKKTKPGWKKYKTIEEIQEDIPEYQLIEAAKEVGLITKSQMKTLHGHLSNRNECAHPSSYNPGVNESLGYVANLLNRIAAIEKKPYP